MRTFEQFAQEISSVPVSVSWYLADLGEALGKQSLFTSQSPRRLKALRENAIIESAISSNRIEGVEIEKDRVGTVIFGNSALHDRGEEEIRGYRDALKLIHEQGRNLHLTDELIRELHYLSRAKLGDAGQYKTHQNDIMEKYPDGRTPEGVTLTKSRQPPGCLNSLVKLSFMFVFFGGN